MTDILQHLTALFGSLMLLAIVVGGFVLMFSPARGRTILCNAAIALAIFVGACILVSALSGSARGALRQVDTGSTFAAVGLWIVTLVIVSAAFVYVFDTRRAKALLTRAAIAAVALFVVPTFFAELFGNVGGITIAVGIAIVSAAAFRSLERQRLRPERRRGGAAARTPLLPRPRARE